MSLLLLWDFLFPPPLGDDFGLTYLSPIHTGMYSDGNRLPISSKMSKHFPFQFGIQMKWKNLFSIFFSFLLIISLLASLDLDVSLLPFLCFLPVWIFDWLSPLTYLYLPLHEKTETNALYFKVANMEIVFRTPFS